MSAWTIAVIVLCVLNLLLAILNFRDCKTRRGLLHAVMFTVILAVLVLEIFS